MSISSISTKLEDGKIAVIAATVSNDERMLTMKKMTICALHFTATAKARIEKAGGRCMTFDQLLEENPFGQNCQMLQGERHARKEYKYFGSAGTPFSHTKEKGVTSGQSKLKPSKW